MQLPEYRIAELKEQFDRRERTAVDLCESFLERIPELD